MYHSELLQSPLDESAGLRRATRLRYALCSRAKAPKGDKGSPNLDEGPPNLDKVSSNLDKRSPNLDKGSPNFV